MDKPESESNFDEICKIASAEDLSRYSKEELLSFYDQVSGIRTKFYSEIKRRIEDDFFETLDIDGQLFISEEFRHDLHHNVIVTKMQCSPVPLKPHIVRQALEALKKALPNSDFSSKGEISPTNEIRAVIDINELFQKMDQNADDTVDKTRESIEDIVED